MKLETFETTLWLPRPLTEVFNFFADATNLQSITPEWLNFEILTPQPLVIRQGTLIDYRLKVRGFPIRWRTEITSWEPPLRFVDRQLRGPYRVWDHEHTFRERDGGTEVRDRVRYAAPLAWLTHPLFVNRDVQAIFVYRQERLRQFFGTPRA
jgi:hypothetical protein